MENMTITPIIPELKARRERERKRGGLAILGEVGGAGGFSGAVGGAAGTAGSAGVAVIGAGELTPFLAVVHNVFGAEVAALLPKFLVLVMGGCLAYGAYSVGLAVKASTQLRSAAPKRAFADKMPVSPTYEDKRNLIHTSMPESSLGFVSGSLDGKTQAQRDAEAAAAKAAADKAAADQAKASAATVPAVPVPNIPATVAAATTTASAAAGTADPAGAMPKAGGNVSAQLGGAAGSSLHSFGFGRIMETAGRLGGSTAMVSAVVGASRVSSPIARFHGGSGAARRQLGVAAASSYNGANTSGPLVTAATYASVPFDSGITPSNTAISGGGAGTNGSQSSGGSGSTSSSSGGASGGAGSGGGANPSVGGSTRKDDCGALFPDGGFVDSSAGGCVCPPGMEGNGVKCGSVKGSNATPEQKLLDLAKMLLMMASVLIMIAMVLGMWAKHLRATAAGPHFAAQMALAAHIYMIAKYLAYAAAMLAAIVTLLGISMLAMGGTSATNGLLYTIIGAITTYLAIRAADEYKKDQASAQKIADTANKNPALTQAQQQYLEGHPNWDPSVQKPGQPGWDPNAPTPNGTGTYGQTYGNNTAVTSGNSGGSTVSSTSGSTSSKTTGSTDSGKLGPVSNNPPTIYEDVSGPPSETGVLGQYANTNSGWYKWDVTCAGQGWVPCSGPQ